MILSIILCVLGAVSLTLFLVERVKAHSAKATILKATTSALFICTGLSAVVAGCGNPSALRYGAFVVGGLVFGLLGDIWLDLKFVYPPDEDTYTFTGFAVFGVGHILYIIGLILTFADPSKPLNIILPVVIAVVIGVVNGMSGKVMKLDYGKYKYITMGYGAILFAMTLLAGSFALQNHFANTTLDLMFAGGVLFLISDLILSGTYFGEGKDRPVDVVTNHVSYYAAQFVIAMSLLFMK